MNDLAVIIVSTNEARWLRPCLTTVFAHMGELRADVVVADNRSTDGTRELVESEFPAARVVTCNNHGFGHANNCGLQTTDARYVVFLNPDTEIREGTFEHLVALMEASPELGLAGVKQITPDGQLYPTIRRFPNAIRAFWQALGSERYPLRAPWLGERELDLQRYENEVACDWTSGSFMIARHEALRSAGIFDERYFLFSDETDLCLRIKKAGWEIRHLPTMTVLHHAMKAGASPKLAAQEAFSRLLYSRKHFSPVHRLAYISALSLGYAVRSVAPGHGAGFARARRSAARNAFRALIGLHSAPFGEPPAVALVRDSDLPDATSKAIDRTRPAADDRSGGHV